MSKRTSTRSALLALVPAIFVTLAAVPARAEPPKEVVAQAAQFFDAGAQAYKAGQYLVAAEAFLKAHTLSPSPALLFSAAQAFRRQYLSQPTPGTLRRAIALYRDYLRSEAAPKRADEAMAALAALVPLEARLVASPPEGDPAAPNGGDAAAGRDPTRGTRLLLTTGAQGAQVSVDGSPFYPAPVVAKVGPGAHKVDVRANGYFDGHASVIAVENELMPGHIDLKPKPGQLTVTGTSGARVLIDGQARATLPLAAPIAVDPGSHFVAVALAGHEPLGKTIEIPRDGAIDLAADLSPTRQRIAAWSVIGVGAAGAVATGIVTGLMLHRQSEATSLRDQQKTTPFQPAQRDQYNRAVAARDDLARAAGITGAASAGVVLAGLGLFAFERAEVPLPADDRGHAPGAPRVEFDVGLGSIGLHGSF